MSILLQMNHVHTLSDKTPGLIRKILFPFLFFSSKITDEYRLSFEIMAGSSWRMKTAGGVLWKASAPVRLLFLFLSHFQSWRPRSCAKWVTESWLTGRWSRRLNADAVFCRGFLPSRLAGLRSMDRRLSSYAASCSWRLPSWFRWPLS